MCSLFWKIMENHDHGDLADIVRASGGGISCSSGNNYNQISDWQFPLEPIKFPSGIEEPIDNFGDPFSSTRDPLLHELANIAGTSAGGFFDSSSNSMDPVKMINNIVDQDDTSSTVNCSTLLAQRIFDEEMIKRPCNIFSRMLQISPNTKMPVSSPRDLSASSSSVVASPRGGTSSSSLVVINNDMAVKGSSSSTGCSVDNSTAVQISSPRNTGGIKRRKSQAKKVVCIPAPAAANSRPSGEVVPSDLWAWRKYGQKPIKGSPYPRGYYRCSSSKGCSARKQVERSRTDPNMLVITYTSEHNHPWPTQRNALAGSTRSQPMKSIAGSKSLPSSQTQNLTNLLLKEEHKENNNNDNSASLLIAGGSSVVSSSSIKEELGETTDEKPIDQMCDGEFSHHQGFHDSTYGSSSLLPDIANHSDDFFADLGELEPDPLNLLFSPVQGFTGGEKSDDQKRENNKALDPFSLFDWTGNNSFEESRSRGL